VEERVGKAEVVTRRFKIPSSRSLASHSILGGFEAMVESHLEILSQVSLCVGRKGKKNGTQ
jgi:hypothetical protein